MPKFEFYMKMLSFEVCIVDVAQKLQKLKFFAFFAQIVLKW